MLKESMTDNPAAKKRTRSKRQGIQEKSLTKKIIEIDAEKVIAIFGLYLIFFSRTICSLRTNDVRLLFSIALKRSL